MRALVRRASPTALLCVAAAVFRACPATAAERKVADVLRAASDHRHRNRHDEALRDCEDVIGREGATEEQRISAFEIMVDVHRRRRRRDDALDAAKRLRTTLAKSAAAGVRSLFMQADLHREAGDTPRSLARLRELVRLHPGERGEAATAQLRMAELLLWARRYPESCLEAAKAAEVAPADDAVVASALRLMQDAARKNNEFGKCASTLRRLLEPRYLKQRHEREHADYRKRLGDCLVRLGRIDEAREYYTSLAAEDGDAGRRHEWVMAAAQTFADDERWDDALKTYELVFTAHADASDRWYDAERAILEAYSRKGDAERALGAARICLDAAWDERRIREGVRLVALALGRSDGNVKRANAFLDFQRYGPAGKDGKPGTRDDIEDPLRSVAYPAFPARERAFAEARAKAGDDALASRHRALTYVYSGHPEKAFAFLIDAFRRSRSRRVRDDVYGLVVTGARTLRGHAAGLDAFVRFVAYGPAGPDGAAGTADDLEDPFKPLIEAPGTARLREEAVRSGHSDEDLKALGELRDYLVGIVGDLAEHRDERRRAMDALCRVNEALGGRLPRGGPRELREVILGLMIRERDDWLQEGLAQLAQAAARAEAHHLGPVHAFWRDVEARCADTGAKLTGRAAGVRDEFRREVSDLARARSYAPSERHLKPSEIKRKDRPRSRPGVKPTAGPEPRAADLTPPAAPSSLAARSVGYTRTEIAWDAAADGESGVAYYVVYRNGAEVAETKATKAPGYADEELSEESKYDYEVLAVSAIGMESGRSRRLTVRTPRDEEAPEIDSVATLRKPDEVYVVFNEPVEEATAAQAANYAIDNGVTVKSASLGADGTTVKLVTSELAKGLTYTMNVTRVRDRARARNVIMPGTTARFEYIETGDGLTGAYYSGRGFERRKAERVDKEIMFNWSGRPAAEGVGPSDFSVRWTGKIRPRHSEEYTFYARTDDGVRLWIDGKKVIDDWRDRGAADSVARVKLAAGKVYDIRMDYFQGGGEASAELFWQSPSTPREIVPQQCLYSR